MAGIHRPVRRLYNTLGRTLAAHFRSAGRRVITVEWGTGGELAAALTAPAGASAYYLAGLVLGEGPADNLDLLGLGRRLGADLVVVLDGLAEPPRLEAFEPATGRRITTALTGVEDLFRLIRVPEPGTA